MWVVVLLPAALSVDVEVTASRRLSESDLSIINGPNIYIFGQDMAQGHH